MIIIIIEDCMHTHLYTDFKLGNTIYLLTSQPVMWDIFNKDFIVLYEIFSQILSPCPNFVTWNIHILKIPPFMDYTTVVLAGRLVEHLWYGFKGWQSHFLY